MLPLGLTAKSIEQIHRLRTIPQYRGERGTGQRHRELCILWAGYDGCAIARIIGAERSSDVNLRFPTPRDWIRTTTF